MYHNMFVYQELRQQLRMLRAYLFTCKQSIADDLRRQVWPREHLYEYVHMYSLAVSNTFMNTSTCTPEKKEFST